VRGIVDYDFEEKNRWRRMMWQRIVARLKRHGVDASTALCLYLPGPQDLDRAVALKKGFAWNNLVAVDIDESNVERLRASGKLAVTGDLVEVLFAWKHRVKPAVIYADFCSNFDPKLIRQLAQLWFLGGDDGTYMAANTVVLLNFQRGRERENSVAKYLAEEDLFAKRFARDFSHGDLKHRGMQFLVFLMAAMQEIEREMDGPVVSGVNGRNETDRGVATIRTFAPECFSYRGKHIQMDSVLLTRTLAVEERVRRGTDDHDESVKRRIAATMALRTTREALAS